MADTYPEHDLKEVKKILKVVMTKFDGTDDYPSWCFGLKIQLIQYKLTYHLMMDDTNNLNVGKGNHQATNIIRMVNCYTVYCFIISNLTGEAQKEIIIDGFLGKPTKVMKTLDRIYDSSQKLRKLQKVKKELEAFRILKTEMIVAINF